MKEQQAKNFVDGLTFVEDSLLKLSILAGLWSGAIYLALGLHTAALWFGIVLVAITIPKLAIFKTFTEKNPFDWPAQVLGFVTAGIWGIAPFMVWQAGAGKFDSLAIMMLGIGFLMVINKYRSMPRPAIIVAAPYLMLCAYFLYQSRLSSTFILALIGTFAYLATLGGFLYSGWKSRQALIQYKLQQDQLLQEVERAKNIAEKANQSKSAFLANMSHELRTPLNGILGLSDVLLGEEMAAGQRRKLGLIRDSGKTLLALLNDILDISKIEADGITIEENDFDLHANFQKSFAFWKPLADKKQIKLVYRKQKDIPQFVRGDIHRMRQCINNLINNALKFTPKNGQVCVTLTGQWVNEQYLIFIEVEDTGIGISKENMNKLFKPFSQADDSTTRKFGGTGLGLVISQRLCRLMGGDITVDSVLGEGTSFCMSCVVEPAANTRLEKISNATAVIPKYNFGGVHCLVVEDNEINLEVLLLLLEPYHMDITVTHNGREALEALQTRRFDIVLMDLQMPVLGGIETTKIIRQSGANYAHIPIVAMTAKTMHGDEKQCLEVGMNGYVSKPLNRTRISEAIANALEAKVEIHASDSVQQLA